MSVINLFKYQAAGNDFVLVDNREGILTFSAAQISKICDRRFGIGADGLIRLEKDQLHDFRMIYHNSDGSQSFCGNGCRAVVHFAHQLGVIGKETTFSAHDGAHAAEILSNGTIRVSVSDVRSIEKKPDNEFYVNTGTDHHVRLVKNLEQYPVVSEGRKIRYSDMYKPNGTNADFLEMNEDGSVAFRIYERGVEDETLSSGSGATACALVAAYVHHLPSPVDLRARGGELRVDFVKISPGHFTSIHFTGPVELVFSLDWKL